MRRGQTLRVRPVSDPPALAYVPLPTVAYRTPTAQANRSGRMAGPGVPCPGQSAQGPRVARSDQSGRRAALRCQTPEDGSLTPAYVCG
jgi:hypothetical protein